MLWWKILNQNENDSIHKGYIIKACLDSNSCFKDELNFLGIIIEVVDNYRDRDVIEKIKNKD